VGDYLKKGSVGMATFKDLPLMPEIQQALDELGFTHPTEIQKNAIPLLLATKKIDFHGQAQTGTGKTLAFGIPLLQRIDFSKHVPQGLIVAPTRELAVQIYESISRIAQKLPVKIAVIYGGVSMEDQIRILKKGVHLIIGTPGRLNDHLRRKTLSVSQVRTLVLDEADIMLDMGFREEIEEILNYVPKDREIWLFSATVKSGIGDLIKEYMEDTVVVRVSQKQIGTQKTKQYYCIVPFKSRLHAITRFIQNTPDFYGFIFCQTKILTSEVAEQLMKRGYNVGALHGDMSQAQRNIVIKKFKQAELTILVATDVAARGIDVANLTHVINYSIPDDLESYVHRIGRTGRAGKEGTAITFISKSEQRILQQIERKFNVQILPIDVPTKAQLVDAKVREASHYMFTAPQQIPSDIEAMALLVNTLSQEQLKPLTTRLLYDKFLSTLDLEEVPYTHVDAPEPGQFQELYLNIGLDDGITREEVKNFLTKTGVIKPEEIKSIRVIKRRTFVMLSSDCSPELLTALREQSFDGRKIHINLTCLIGNTMPSRGRSRPFTERRSDRGRRRRSR
jgi:ATP-dependent RNA helicase DeaD